MKKAPPPQNEQKRLAVLREYKILDTPSERDFDELTKLASAICETPIALVSLVDEARQWFKSRTGLEATETHRDYAFCAHAILGDSLFVVPDSNLDDRFKDNPLVTGAPHVRFYAGMPLRSYSGENMGTICVIDHESRSLDAWQTEALRSLARQVVHLLELRLLQRNADNRDRGILAAIAHNMLEGAVLQDQKGRIIKANPAALDVLGLTEEQLLGRASTDPTWKTIREDGSAYPGSEHPAMVALATGKSQLSQRMGVVSGETGTRWLMINSNLIYPAGEGGEKYVLSTFTDITALKRLEKAAKDEAERANAASQAKSQFLANMSHEIRTPINGVLGMAALAQDTALTAEQKQYIDGIQRSGETLLTVINDILDFSKIEAGKLDFELINFNLKEVIEDTVQSFSFEAKNKNIAIRSEVDPQIEPWLKGDPGRLRQVLNNLIGNALKFTSTGQVRIVVEPVESEKSFPQIKFKVIDSGIGIPKEALERMFKPFSQADSSTTRRFGGTGLGLSISKRLVEMMGGAIGVESTQGQGSTFWFTAGFQVGEEETHSNEFPELSGLPDLKDPQSFSSAKILVAEDNTINQVITLKMLKKMGYHATAVGNGEEATRAIRGGGYDLVLMDCQMPEMDGYEATRIIRQYQRPDTPRITIIAMTAYAMKGAEKECLDAGMDDYVVKPISAKKLQSILEKWLNRGTARAVKTS